MRIAWKPLAWGLSGVLLVAVLLSGLVIRYVWNETLQQNGVETLEWQGVSLSFSGVSVDQLELTQSLPTRKMVVHARQVKADWRWPEWGEGWQPRLMALTADYLALDWHNEPGKPPADTRPATEQWPSKLPDWLPFDVLIHRFEVVLPCETGRCPLAGSLSIASAQSDESTAPVSSSADSPRLPIKASARLDREGHLVDVLAAVDGSPADELNVSAELAIDGTRYLSAQSSYNHQHTTDRISLRGSADIPDLPQTDWLLAWLKTWLNVPIEPLPEEPERGSAEASWQLQGPKSERFLAQATGTVNMQARVPQPWPAPGLGTISGNIDVALEARQGQWQPEKLQADLALSHPAAWIKKLPELARPDSLTLSVRPAPAVVLESANVPAVQAGPEQALLPMKVELSSRGDVDISMDSHLAVATRAPWRVQLGETQLTATLPELQVAGWELTRPGLQVALTGSLDTTSATLKLGESARMDVDGVEPGPDRATTPAEAIRVKNLRADLANTTLKADYRPGEGELDKLALNGSVGLKAGQVEHPQLRSQPWEFNGKLQSNLARTHLSGVLKANTGTTMNLDLNALYPGPFRFEGNMRVSGKQEIDALSRIAAAWPPVLTVSGGTVSANAIYEQPLGGPMRFMGKLVFTDVSGTYDRTAWSKMNGSTEFRLENDRVRMTAPELTVAEINPGLPVGPLRVAGHYDAPLARLSAGQLTLEEAQSGALGGEVQVRAGHWDLAQAPVTIPVEIHKLSIARLLQLYPAEGLAGTGILSGTVPLLFDPATGIRVKRGQIDALKPGGRLQLTAQRLKALATENETMKLVAKALEDFRYSILDSGIDYDEDGTLMLNLHLEGSSPDVSRDRPVVLNINLEENIPALLTSLQLSGRVSDAVTERVKKLLQKRESDQDDLIE